MTGVQTCALPISFAKPHLLKQELDIEDVLMNSGTLSAQTLASGQVKIIVTTSAVVPQFNLSGGDMVIIAGTINKLPYQIIARGEIKRTETSTKTSGEVVDLLAALARSVEKAKASRGEAPEPAASSSSDSGKGTAKKILKDLFNQDTRTGLSKSQAAILIDTLQQELDKAEAK